jgi:hypothetical protein
MWLWAAATEDAEAFRLLPGRDREQAKDLIRQWDSLWTYLQRDRTVPTNNSAELAVRKAVLWRKVSLGADSKASSINNLAIYRGGSSRMTALASFSV